VRRTSLALRVGVALAKQKKEQPIMSTKSKWFDEASNTSLIDEQAQKLGPFLAAMADGKIDSAEVKAQEGRLVAAMREAEPLLNDEQHAKVTNLLVELAAYDLMQVLHTLHAARPKTRFVG
jgi:hypothetical protein